MAWTCPNAQAVDPETGRVRILYIGDGWGPSPVPFLRSDPGFDLVSVPTSTLHADVSSIGFSTGVMRKLVRLYMPRSLAEMLAKHDLTILSDANPFFIAEKYLTWIRDSTVDNGLGLVMVGGMESFGAPKGMPWTSLEDMLPVDIGLDITQGYYFPSFKVQPARDHRFTRSLPWRSMPFFHGMNRLTLKEGATLLLEAEGHPYPPLSYWEFGEGVSVAHAPDWTPVSGGDVMRWEFYLDYVANIAYLATGSRIPENPYLIHSLRTGFWSMRVRLTSVVDIAGFVEKFGANSYNLERKLAESRDLVASAERLYVLQEYEAARRRIAEIEMQIKELQGQAMDLKDRALLWVYVVEWSVTLGIGILAGVALWALMVRRNLYTAVGVTRLRRGEE
jgi:uncharacterized membrane protein